MAQRRRESETEQVLAGEGRILAAIELLRVVAVGLPDDYEPLTPRYEFDDAHARTHQMQVMMVGFIQGPALATGATGA
jgi:hypothetical protein